MFGHGAIFWLIILALVVCCLGRGSRRRRRAVEPEPEAAGTSRLEELARRLERRVDNLETILTEPRGRGRRSV